MLVGEETTFSSQLLKVFPQISDRIAGSDTKDKFDILLSLTKNDPEEITLLYGVASPSDIAIVIRSIMAGAGGNLTREQKNILCAIAGDVAPDAARDIRSFFRDEDPEVRRMATDAAGKAMAKDVIPDLIGLLQDKEAIVRRSAITAIAALDAKEQTPALIKLLGDQDVHCRRAAIGALGKLGAKEAADKIAAYLSDRETAASALDALIRLGSKELIPKISVLYQRETVLYRETLHALLDLVGADAVADLRGLLKHTSPLMRETAIDGLCHLHAVGATDDIESLLADESVSVRGLAAIAMVELGAKERLLSKGVSNDVVDALRHMVRFDGNNSKRAERTIREIGLADGR